MTDAYDRVTYQGHPMDKMTRAAIERLEQALGYNTGELTVLQGCYGNTVSASAGTHSGGGAFDLTANDWQRKVKLGRELGLAIWHRTAIPGVWVEHVHAIVIGNKLMSPSAARQVTAYYAHRDGLAGNRPDPTWHPNPITPFHYTEEPADMTPDQIKDALIPMNVGPEGKREDKTLQEVLRDLEDTQDRHGAQLAEILSLLKKAVASGK